MTVASAVRAWAAEDYDRLTELVRTSPLAPHWWAWGACVMLARICDGPGGPEWLLRVAPQVEHYANHQFGAK